MSVQTYTPETNAAIVDWSATDEDCVYADFAKNLERDRNRLRAELAAVTAQHAACLAELAAISAALGTNEGHSSVKHIRGLKAECVTLKRKILN